MIAQGWSLNYEMFFYMLFAIVLLFPRRWSIPMFIVALLIMGRLGGILTIGNFGTIMHIINMSGTLAHYFVEYLWEFAFGAAIGFAYSNGLRLPRSVAVACVVLGIALLLSSILYQPAIYTGRSIHWGIPCAIIVAGAVNLGQHLDGRWRAIVKIGDASYAQYLFHAMVMLWLATHWPHLNFLIETVGPWGIVVYLTAMSVRFGCDLRGGRATALARTEVDRSVRETVWRFGDQRTSKNIIKGSHLPMVAGPYRIC
jgi:peptidoglycan/LPS O-acetylase OafA/YrhL